MTVANTIQRPRLSKKRVIGLCLIAERVDPRPYTVIELSHVRSAVEWIRRIREFRKRC